MWRSIARTSNQTENALRFDQELGMVQDLHCGQIQGFFNNFLLT